ncbi:hypothetical protein M427DRAFT_138242 [Gonapodya prolifera JEL478]|uniref:Uncharacterized protein n=1 Tax=Gonapodya prolifera (strain JEL478) TaxID=1344416 RepID=A0A139A3T5_GONPJ|nr:hypothetical protein M427DRAFT_138242 [Gonapodya prolifera JEL478]|eukprot:KXS11462.1 hypothetical protein M427DRAFT_138242 [Gonapodya prolifera JEL478]
MNSSGGSTAIHGSSNASPNVSLSPASRGSPFAAAAGSVNHQKDPDKQLRAAIELITDAYDSKTLALANEISHWRTVSSNQRQHILSLETELGTTQNQVDELRKQLDRAEQEKRLLVASKNAVVEKYKECVRAAEKLEEFRKSIVSMVSFSPPSIPTSGVGDITGVFGGDLSSLLPEAVPTTSSPRHGARAGGSPAETLVGGPGDVMAGGRPNSRTGGGGGGGWNDRTQSLSPTARGYSPPSRLEPHHEIPDISFDLSGINPPTFATTSFIRDQEREQEQRSGLGEDGHGLNLSAASFAEVQFEDSSFGDQLSHIMSPSGRGGNNTREQEQDSVVESGHLRVQSPTERSHPSTVLGNGLRQFGSPAERQQVPASTPPLHTTRPPLSANPPRRAAPAPPQSSHQVVNTSMASSASSRSAPSPSPTDTSHLYSQIRSNLTKREFDEFATTISRFNRGEQSADETVRGLAKLVRDRDHFVRMRALVYSAVSEGGGETAGAGKPGQGQEVGARAGTTNVKGR